MGWDVFETRIMNWYDIETNYSQQLWLQVFQQNKLNCSRSIDAADVPLLCHISQVLYESFAKLEWTDIHWCLLYDYGD